MNEQIGDSDLLTLYNAYCAWKRIRTTSGMNEDNEFTFCKKNSLSPQALLNIEDVKTQLIVSIVDMGLLKLGSEEQIALNRFATCHRGPSWKGRSKHLLTNYRSAFTEPASQVEIGNLLRYRLTQT